MGAWGHKVLSNDCALDTMADLSAGTNVASVKQQLYDIMHGKSYIEDLLLAVAIVDASINGLDVEIFGDFYDHEEWLRYISKEPMTDLKEDALHVIRFIQKNDDGWVEDCILDRMHLLKLIETRLLGKPIMSEEQQNELKNNLRKTIYEKLEDDGDKDIEVGYITMYYVENPIYALADVSYTWELNGYAKRVVHKNMIFVLKDSVWYSPIFH